MKEILTRINNITEIDNLHENIISEVKIVTADRKRNPERYKRWEGEPFLKSNLIMTQCVDAMMHLLFLSVTKAANQLFDKWLILKKFKIP